MLLCGLQTLFFFFFYKAKRFVVTRGKFNSSKQVKVVAVFPATELAARGKLKKTVNLKKQEHQTRFDEGPLYTIGQKFWHT